VFDELTTFDPPVEGAIPPQLNGWYLRNGPNPRHGHETPHWFDDCTSEDLKLWRQRITSEQQQDGCHMYLAYGRKSELDWLPRASLD
jgi:Retinal pigment epithelial membrane protein